MDTLAMIINVPRSLLSITSMDLALLPITEGGMGLISAMDIADSAYVASFAAAMDSLILDFPNLPELMLQEGETHNLPAGISSFLAAIKRLQITDNNLSVESILKMDGNQRSKLQKTLSIPRKLNRTTIFRNKLMASKSVEDNNLLSVHLSCTGHDAAGWLLAIPKSPETVMNPQVFRTALRLRLLVSDPDFIPNQFCHCSLSRLQPSLIDPFDYHFHKCKHNSGLATHTSLNKALKNLICVTTRSPVTVEPTRQFARTNPESQMRMDLTYIPIKGGPVVGYDATVTHPVSAIMTHKQACTTGRAAAFAENRKIVKYGSICRENTIAFTPIVYEVGGRPGELWSKEIKRLYGMHPDGGHNSFRQYWSMTISVALQTGIANAILIRKGTLQDNNRRKLAGGFKEDGLDAMLDCTYANIGGIGSTFDG